MCRKSFVFSSLVASAALSACSDVPQTEDPPPAAVETEPTIEPDSDTDTNVTEEAVSSETAAPSADDMPVIESGDADEIVDASPSDLVDSAQGFDPAPMDDTSGFDPSPADWSAED